MGFLLDLSRWKNLALPRLFPEFLIFTKGRVETYMRPRSSFRPTEATLEAEGWRLEVEQADIMADFSALNGPV